MSDALGRSLQATATRPCYATRAGADGRSACVGSARRRISRRVTDLRARPIVGRPSRHNRVTGPSWWRWRRARKWADAGVVRRGGPPDVSEPPQCEPNCVPPSDGLWPRGGLRVMLSGFEQPRTREPGAVSLSVTAGRDPAFRYAAPSPQNRESTKCPKRTTRRPWGPISPEETGSCPPSPRTPTPARS